MAGFLARCFSVPGFKHRCSRSASALARKRSRRGGLRKAPGRLAEIYPSESMLGLAALQIVVGAYFSSLPRLGDVIDAWGASIARRSSLSVLVRSWDSRRSAVPCVNVRPIREPSTATPILRLPASVGSTLSSWWPSYSGGLRMLGGDDLLETLSKIRVGGTPHSRKRAPGRSCATMTTVGRSSSSEANAAKAVDLDGRCRGARALPSWEPATSSRSEGPRRADGLSHPQRAITKEQRRSRS